MIDSLAAAFIERETGAAHTGRTFEDAASNSRGLWQRMALDSLLVGHRGCVNHVEFSEQGTLLASGSDDTKLCLWDMQSSKPLTVNMTGHSQNIFCVRFMPTTSDSSQPLIATCAGDGEVRLHDLTSGSKSVYNHHMSRVKKLVTEPGNPNLIISCSEDGTVRQIDTREPARNSVQLLQLARNGVKLEINSISAPWHRPWLLAVGGSDDLLRVYDRRTAGTTAGSRPRITGPKCVAHFSPGSHSEAFSSDCITGVAFSDDGSQVLANYLGDYVYLWSVDDLISSKPLNLGQQNTAAAAATARKGKRARQDYSPGSTAAATAAAAADQRQATAHASAADGLTQDSPAAAAEGLVDDPDQMVLDDGHDDDAAAAAVADGIDDEGAAAAATVPANRVLSVDAAVELLERGDLRLPRRRQGALASMILNRSQDLYERNEVEASLRYATAALRLRATFGMAHYQAAICHERLGNPAAALAAGEAALQYAWGYDLQQFVRRLTRNMQAAAAAEHGEQQQQQVQGDQQRERHHRQQQIEQMDQQQQQQHDQQQQQDSRRQQQQDSRQQQQEDGVRPLPPALMQRLQNRGILKAQDAAAAGAAEDGTNPPPPPAAAAAAAAAGDQSYEQQQRDEDMLDSETAAAAAAAADSGGLAAAAAAASGGSESWSPSSNGGSSSSSSGQGSGSSSNRSGSSSSSSGASDTEASSHSSPSTSTDGDHYMLVDVSGSGHSSGSSSSSNSSSSSSSSGGGSSGSSDDHGSGSDDEHFTSASDVSWLSDSESDEENELEDMLGLDVRHRIYDWGGQDAAATAAAAGSSPQQQQDPAANGIPSHYSDGENDDRNRFGEFLEPLRHQLLLLRARQQHRQQQRAAAAAWQQRVRAAAAGLRQEQQSKLRAEWLQMERGMWNEIMQQESGTAEQQQQQHLGQQQQLLAAAGERGTGGDQVESLIDEELLGYVWMLAAQVLLPQEGGCQQQQQQQQQEQQVLQRGGEASDQQQQHAEVTSDQQQQGAHRHQQQQQQQMQQQSTAASVDMPLVLVLLPEPTDSLENVVRLTDDRPAEEQQQQQQQRIQHLQLQQAQLLSAVQWHFSCEDALQIRKQVAEVRVRCCMALQQLVAQWRQQQQRRQQQHEVTSVLHDEQLQQQFKDLIEQYSSKIGDLCGQQIIKAHEQYQQMATAHANAGVAAAAAVAAGSGYVDQAASGSDSDSESDDLSEIMEEGDLLDERDPIICELGKALAAGEFGSGSGSRSAAEQDEASAATAGPNSSRTGAVLLDGSDAAAGAAAGGLRQHKWSCRYRGHVSLKTVKDVAFIAPGHTMVAAGSDDGRLYVWDRHTGELLTALRADRYVVNCVAGHPNLPMMASCGIDNTVKLWTPCLNQPRPLDSNLLFSLGYNEVERSAESSMMRTGFGDMCKAFSKQRALQMVEQIKQQQEQAAAAAAPAGAIA